MEKGFNEAQAFQPGKLGQSVLARTYFQFASMRPKPFSLGNDRDTVITVLATAGFNEAQAFQPGKHGRDCDALEAVQAASMRPKPFSLGNRFQKRTLWHRAGCFNEAQAFQPGKHAEARKHNTRLEWLQ